MGGDDTITGNSDTRVSYLFALAGVTVDIHAISGNGANNFQEGQGGADTLIGGPGLTISSTLRPPTASTT
jgi:hypothetical protein